LGILGSDTLSLEGSGIISQVGSTVTDLRVGDRVMFGPMSKQSCLATRVTMPSQSCLKIPRTLSFEEAATMPAVYSTTIHSIIELAQLRKAQTVLIHAACGGVGLAVIQICRNIVGAEVS
jgi:NADPH:quinone reductase-like Zn-dependent oxidoreductase